MQISESQAAFLESGVSIIGASRDGNNIPVLARAIGCRVLPDRVHVQLLFKSSGAVRLLDALRSGAPLAAVFCQPSTHYSLQLKGHQVVLAPPEASSFSLADKLATDFVREVCPLGYREELIRSFLSADPSDLVSVTFAAEACFLQSPGPRAGEALNA